MTKQAPMCRMRTATRRALLAGIGTAGLVAAACQPAGDDPQPSEGAPTVEDQTAPLPFEAVGEIDGGEFREASGVAFHRSRRTLFVVTDEGTVGELRTDGSVVQRRHLLYEDFEGITVNPSNGLLYIVIEGRDNVLEVDPEGLTILREFDVARDFNGRTLYVKSGDGLEGIAFAEDPGHPEGGTFFLVNRSDAKRASDPPLLLEAELPLSSDSTDKLEGTLKSYALLDIEDLSGLHFDPATQILTAISDEGNLMIRMRRNGEIVSVYPLPGNDVEGVAFDGAGNLYIAQDSVGILKLTPKPAVSAGTEPGS